MMLGFEFVKKPSLRSDFPNTDDDLSNFNWHEPELEMVESLLEQKLANS